MPPFPSCSPPLPYGRHCRRQSSAPSICTTRSAAEAYRASSALAPPSATIPARLRRLFGTLPLYILFSAASGRSVEGDWTEGGLSASLTEPPSWIRRNLVG
ncbi:hypothetical protein K445DRAFT_188461 [Daldinia sp. EC12]|nr:hypothetical protein F4774DRAFT_293498 [Daldinia eschscholtzii]OTB19077.1 hypothetical protein K445DRAFT_188461 [Daldinia sp. EC12]